MKTAHSKICRDLRRGAVPSFSYDGGKTWRRYSIGFPNSTRARDTARLFIQSRGMKAVEV